MGSWQNPYSARVVLATGGKTLFDRTFTGLKQRKSDYATVFPITGVAQSVAKGSAVTLSITPLRATALACGSADT